MFPQRFFASFFEKKEAGCQAHKLESKTNKPQQDTEANQKTRASPTQKTLIQNHKKHIIQTTPSTHPAHEAVLQHSDTPREPYIQEYNFREIQAFLKTPPRGS